MCAASCAPFMHESCHCIHRKQARTQVSLHSSLPHTLLKLSSKCLMSRRSFYSCNHILDFFFNPNCNYSLLTCSPTSNTTPSQPILHSAIVAVTVQRGRPGCVIFLNRPHLGSSFSIEHLCTSGSQTGASSTSRGSWQFLEIF